MGSSTKNWLDNALKKSISNNGKAALQQIIRAFGDVIWLCLNGRTSAKVISLKVHPKPYSIPVRAAPRRHSPGKRQFIEKYVENLLPLRFSVPTEDPKWVSTPSIVSKKQPAMFRMALDNHPIIAVTLPIFCQIPDISNELSIVKGSKRFSRIDFCSGDWQLGTEEDS